MAKEYPITFTLEDGVHVSVNKTAENTYDFTLTRNGDVSHFNYVDDGNRLKDDEGEVYTFDQLNAVRRFWLEQHDVV